MPRVSYPNNHRQLPKTVDVSSLKSGDFFTSGTGDGLFQVLRASGENPTVFVWVAKDSPGAVSAGSITTRPWDDVRKVTVKKAFFDYEEG